MNYHQNPISAIALFAYTANSQALVAGKSGISEWCYHNFAIIAIIINLAKRFVSSTMQIVCSVISGFTIKIVYCLAYCIYWLVCSKSGGKKVVIIGKSGVDTLDSCHIYKLLILFNNLPMIIKTVSNKSIFSAKVSTLKQQKKWDSHPMCKLLILLNKPLKSSPIFSDILQKTQKKCHFWLLCLVQTIDFAQTLSACVFKKTVRKSAKIESQNLSLQGRNLYIALKKMYKSVKRVKKTGFLPLVQAIDFIKEVSKQESQKLLFWCKSVQICL